MTAFVLVPGAGGVAEFWHLVADRLAARGHTPIAVDLPGPDPTLGLEHYVDLVREAIPGPDTVVVAQSLGGFSASWAVASTPVRELVLLNAMIPVPGETAGDWWERTGQGAAQAASDRALGHDPDGPFDLVHHFLHDVPADALVGVDERDEHDVVFATPWGPDAWPDVPTRVVAAEGDRLFPFEFQERIAWQRLGQDVERIPGGHLAALSQPDAVTAAILDEEF